MVIKKGLRMLVLTTVIANSIFSASASANGLVAPQSPNEGVTISIPADSPFMRTGYYIENVKPGEDKTYEFVIGNTYDDPLNVKFYVSDSISATNGGKSQRDPGDKNELVGTWFMEQSPKDILVHPKSNTQVKVHAHIPDDLKPGQYIAVVTVGGVKSSEQKQEVDLPNKEKASFTTEVLNNKGIQVVFNYDIENATHQLDATDDLRRTSRGVENEFIFSLKNSGTILEKPSGAFRIKDSKGEVISEQEFQADSIYGGTTADIPIYTNLLLKEGNYTVEVTGLYANNQKFEKIYSFEVSPKEEASAVTVAKANGVEVIQPEKIPDWVSTFIVGIGLLVLVLIGVIIILIVRMKRKQASSLRG